jgi:hypothetical protein
MRCSRCASLFVLMAGRALAVLQLLGFQNVRCCRCAMRRAASLPPCTAATSVTAMFAPVCQGAAQARALLPDRPSATISTDVGALEERAALGVLMRAVGAQQRLCVKDGHMCMASSRAPKAAGITHPCHMHVWTRWAGEVSRKMSDVSVPRCDAIGVARLGRFPGQQCDRTSKLECCELTVVVSSRIPTHKILGCGGAALWGRGCERPFRHSYTNVYTPCRPFRLFY